MTAFIHIQVIHGNADQINMLINVWDHKFYFINYLYFDDLNPTEYIEYITNIKFHLITEIIYFKMVIIHFKCIFLLLFYLCRCKMNVLVNKYRFFVCIVQPLQNIFSHQQSLWKIFLVWVGAWQQLIFPELVEFSHLVLYHGKWNHCPSEQPQVLAVFYPVHF